MFIIGNFFLALAKITDLVLWLYMWIIVIRALISWVSPNPMNPIVRTLYGITDPFLYWIRRTLRLPPMAIDVSPLIAIVIVLLLKYFLVATFFRIGLLFGGRL